MLGTCDVGPQVEQKMRSRSCPTMTRPGGSLTGRYVVTSRTFKLGEAIRFTPPEIGDVGLTFRLAAQQLNCS